MVLVRSEAVELAAFIHMIQLNETERNKLRSDALAECESDPDSEEASNHIMRNYLKDRLSMYRNSYISTMLSRYGYDLKVKGIEPDFYACPCCGYKTLPDWGEYSICSVCFWEDDGCRDMDRHSGVNHMTLSDARSNFLLYGAMGESSVRFLEADRFIQYHKE